MTARCIFLLFMIGSFNLEIKAQTGYRLVNYRTETYNGGTENVIPKDSFCYFWSGKRGKNFPTLDKFYSDSVQDYSFDLGESKMKLKFEHYNNFNTYDKSTGYLRKAYLNGATFGDQAKTNFTYDAAGNETARFYLFYNNIDFNKFDSTAAYYYSYDAGNHLVKEVLRSKQGTSLNYNSEKDNQYDASNNLAVQTERRWSAGQWVNYSRSSYTYNTKQKITEKFTETWINNQWVPQLKYTYTYSTNHVEIEQLILSWDGTKWSNNYRISGTLNAEGFVSSKTNSNWFSGTWVPISRKLYEYDGNGDLTQETDLKFVVTQAPDSGIYFFNTRNLNSFDDNHNKITTTSIDLSGQFPDITFSDTLQKITYRYESYVLPSGIPNRINKQMLMAYPVPSSQTVYLEMPAHTINQLADIILSDSRGALYQQLSKPVSSTISLDINTLPSGIYHVSVLINGELYNSNFIKLD